jgi:hypothetical protein
MIARPIVDEMCRWRRFVHCRPSDTSPQRARDGVRPSLSPGSFSTFERSKPADAKPAPNSPTKLISTAHDAITTGARLVVPHRVNASVNLLSQFSAPGDSWIAPIGTKAEGTFTSTSPSPAVLSPSFQLSNVAPAVKCYPTLWLRSTRLALGRASLCPSYQIQQTCRKSKARRWLAGVRLQKQRCH